MSKPSGNNDLITQFSRDSVYKCTNTIKNFSPLSIKYVSRTLLI